MSFFQNLWNNRSWVLGSLSQLKNFFLVNLRHIVKGVEVISRAVHTGTGNPLAGVISKGAQWAEKGLDLYDEYQNVRSNPPDGGASNNENT